MGDSQVVDISFLWWEMGDSQVVDIGCRWCGDGRQSGSGHQLSVVGRWETVRWWTSAVGGVEIVRWWTSAFCGGRWETVR